jgi:hypothetical protein
MPMHTVTTGKVQHANSRTIEQEVTRWATSAHTISNAVAAAIAAGFQSPSAADMPFTMLAQGSVVNRRDLRQATRREIESGRYDAEATDSLYALLHWALVR